MLWANIELTSHVGVDEGDFIKQNVVSKYDLMPEPRKQPKKLPKPLAPVIRELIALMTEAC